MADDERRPLSAVDYYAPARGAAVQSPDRSAGTSYGTSYQDWYGGRNVQGTVSGWGADFFRRAIEQRNEQIDASARAGGDPGKYYDWFQREDATGVATWNDAGRMVRAEDGRLRGLRAGDVFDGGRFVHNIYDAYDEKDADVMLGEFVWDGGEKARIFERESKSPGAIGDELRKRIGENTKQAEFGAQAFDTRKDVAQRQKDIDKDAGIWDEVLSTAAGVVGGAATGAVFGGIPGAVVGGIWGGVTSLMAADEYTEIVARAQVQAQRAREQGEGGNAWGTWLQATGALTTKAISPLQNTVSGAYEVFEGDWGDGVSDFNAVSPITGERIASGWWQGAHLLSAVGDGFLQFGSRPALAVYQAGIAQVVAGKAVNLAQNTVWSDAEGGWHEMEDWGERGAAIASVGVDALQLGISQGVVRAAQQAKAVATGQSAENTFLRTDLLASKVDEAWSVLPGITARGKESREAYRAAKEAGQEVRTETLSGRRYMFGENGELLGSRTAAMAFVPSELTRWLPSGMMARYKAIRRNSGSYAEVSVEDLYEASLKLSGNGGRLRDAMLNAFAEGSEEMFQTVADTLSYSGELSAEEVYRAGAYGFASGLGMGIGPMLSRASTDEGMRQAAYLYEFTRSGEVLTEEQWSERWAAMSDVEKRRASTGSRKEMAQVEAIRRTISERHRIEVGRNGLVPYLALQQYKEEALEQATAQAGARSETTSTAKLLAAETFATQKMVDEAAKRGESVFERAAFVSDAAAMSSSKMAREYESKQKTVRGLVETQRAEVAAARSANDPGLAELEAELARTEQTLLVLDNIARLVRGISNRASATENMDKRIAALRGLNTIVRMAATTGRFRVKDKDGNDVAVAPEVVRSAARMLFSRHPYIEAGSYFSVVPQVHVGYELDNMHGSIGFGIWMAEAAQLDFDGDTGQSLHQVVIGDDKLLLQEAGVQFLTAPRAPKDGEFKWWHINSGRPKDEGELLQRLYEVTGGDPNSADDRVVALNRMLARFKKEMRRDYGGLLAPTLETADPFGSIWARFEAELYDGRPDAVENFMKRFVNFGAGQGGQALIDAAREAGRPLVLDMQQQFTVALQNFDRTMKMMDPRLTKARTDKQNTDPIPETNRMYVQQIARRDASTNAQTVQLMYSSSGERATQHLSYVPWLQYAIDIAFSNDPKASLTEQEMEFQRAFFVEAGPGRAESQDERVHGKDSTVRRAQGWVASVAKVFTERIEGKSETLDLLPEMGRTFLAAGVIAPDMDADGNGGQVYRDPHGDRGKARRSDISIAQLLLRKSVQVDRRRHATTKKDDPIHANLSRLDRLSRREGGKSVQSFRALRELFGDVPPEELVGPEAAALLNGMTMNETLDMFRIKGRDAVEKQLKSFREDNDLYRRGSKMDAPWTLEEVQTKNLNAFTLFVDTLAAVARTEMGVHSKKDRDTGKAIRESLTILQELRTDVRTRYGAEVRKYFRLKPTDPITDDMVSDYILWNEDLAREVVELFGMKSRLATFALQTGSNLPTSREWVSQVLKEPDPRRAELMLLVESAFDLLNSHGARINRDPKTKKIVVSDARPVKATDNLESRLALLINELASRSSAVELARFFEMYERNLQAGSVETFFEEINREALWLAGRPELLPYTDSIKDFEADPRDVWNAGTMNTQRLERLRGMADRLRMTSKSLQKHIDKTAADNVLAADLLALVEAEEAVRQNLPNAQRALDKVSQETKAKYGWLKQAIQYRVNVAPVHGARIRDSTMLLANEVLDLSDKGAADIRMKAMGDAYVLGTSINLQPALMAEFDHAFVYNSDTVIQNPDLLMRGPALVQTKDGRYVALNLTTAEGFVRAYQDAGMRALIDMAVFGGERDMNSEGGLNMYSEFDEGAKLIQKLESGVNRVVWSVDGEMSVEQAEYVISSFEGYTRRVGENSGDADVIREAFLPIQTTLNLLMQAYSTQPGWESRSFDEKLQAANRAKIKVATLLVQMSQLKGDDSPAALAKLVEAEFVSRWYSGEHQVQDVFKEAFAQIRGDTDAETQAKRALYFLETQGELTKKTLDLIDQHAEFKQVQRELEAAEARNDAQEADRLRAQIARAGWSDRMFESVLAQQQEKQDALALFLSGKAPVTESMVNYRSALASFLTNNSDRSDDAQARRYRLYEAAMRYSQRMEGKTTPFLVRTFLNAARTNGDQLMAGNVPHITDTMWAELAVIMAKQATADYAGPSGSSIMFATNPSLKESDGFHYWDESFSYLARRLFGKHVLDAARWFGDTHQTGVTDMESVLQYAMTSGPFAESDFGRWNPALVGTAINMQKALEGASVSLAVPIGGNLPKTQFDASVASYTDWKAQVKPEHLSRMRVTLTDNNPPGEFSLKNFRLDGIDEHRPDEGVPAPLGKLHMHFVKNIDWDDQQILAKVEAFYRTPEKMVQYLMGPPHSVKDEVTARLIVTRTMSAQTSNPPEFEQWVADMVAEARDALNSSLLEPVDTGADPNYMLFDVTRLSGVLAELAKMTGERSLSFTVEYVDIDKKPFTPEYRNHGMFDGVGRRAQIDTAVSPWGAMFFGVGALSKDAQQQVFDYAAKGGSSYKPYYPTRRAEYAEMEAQAKADAAARRNSKPPKRAAPVTALMRKMTQHIMDRNFSGHADLIADDWNAVYKMVVGRTIYKGKDPAGVERLMWAEEVIALEQDDSNQGWDTSSLKRIPLSEEVFRLLHGAATMEAGLAVTRPEWNIDKIDKHPSLDPARLASLGLENLGEDAAPGTTELSMVTPLSKRNKLSVAQMTSYRSSLRRKQERGEVRRGKAMLDRMDDKSVEFIREHRGNMIKKITNELDPETLKSVQNMVQIPPDFRDADAMASAAKAVNAYKDRQGEVDKVFYLTADPKARANYVTGLLNLSSISLMDDSGKWPTYDDLVAINLTSFLSANNNDIDVAFDELKAVITTFAERGTKLVFTAPGQPVLSSMLAEWMGQGQLGYTRSEGSRFAWEPITEDNFESATEAAIRSSLSATSTFLARNAHVNMHLMSMGHFVDENAGTVLRPGMLNTPTQQRWALLPDRLSVHKFNRPNGELVFKPPAQGTDLYEAVVTQAREYVAANKLEMAKMASSNWAKVRTPEEVARDGMPSWEEGMPRWVENSREVERKDPNDPSKKIRVTVYETEPKDVQIYRRFDETGTERPGIRSFDEAYQRLLMTLQSGKLPLWAGQEGNMAGDFVVERDAKGRLFFFRLGFEVPSVEALDEMFADGKMVAVVPPKLDESTVVPANFKVVDNKYDPRGTDYLIEATLSIWSKTVMQGDALKYTMSPMLEQFNLPDVMAGQNGRDVTFMTSSAAQDAKMGYSRRATRLKGVWGITGMDLRPLLVKYFTGDDFASTTDPKFNDAWEKTLSVLKAWSNNDFGYDEQQVRRLLSTGMLFTEAEVDLAAQFEQILGPLRKADPSLTFRLPKLDSMTEQDMIEQRIVEVYLGTLMVPKIKPAHISYTPGVWSVKDPLTSTAAIIDMPDLFSDSLGEDVRVRNWFIDQANARVARFPQGHPLAGHPVAFWNEDFRFHYALQNASDGKWFYADGWASIDFPVTASQNENIYANASILNQNSGFTPHVAAVLALSMNGRMVEKKPDPAKRNPLDHIFDNKTQKFAANPQEALNTVLRLTEEFDSFTPEDRALQRQAVEQRRRAAAITAYEDFEYRVDRSGAEWESKNPEIRKLIREIAVETGIDDTHGSLSTMLDHMVRMFYGYPGPIGKDQQDYREHVTPEDYLEALGHFLRQLKRNADPMHAGALPLMPPSFAIALYNAGRWKPALKRKINGTVVLADGWDNWTRVIFGQFFDLGQPVESMWSEEFDGLFALWQGKSEVLHGMGVSLDTIRSLLPKNRQLNEYFDSMDMITQAAIDKPLMLDAWDTVDAVFKGVRTPAELNDLRTSKIARAELANRKRRQFLAKKEAPEQADLKMTPKDYLEKGNLYIDRGTNQNRIFAGLTNLSHITRLFDFNIYASGYLEQPYRMMFEHVTDLLTGAYLGRGSRLQAAEWLGGKVTSSRAWNELGFGEFKQAYTREDNLMLQRFARTLGDDSRWLGLLHEDTQFMAAAVKGGKSKIEQGIERTAGSVSRVMSDPLYGSSQYAVAMRYLTGAIGHLHAMGQDVSIPGLIDAMRRDPLFLQKQYGDVGLTAHRAGMNRVLQVRSQKATPWSRLVSRSIASLNSSPHRAFKLFGFAANIPFAYTRYMANGLQFITGMDGWQQAGSMFFSGRRRPKWLRGGMNGVPDYWDLEDTLETMDLARTFVRSGTTLTMLFTLGMLAGGQFGFLGENEEERRRRKQAMYMGLVDVKDPMEPENNFLNADAIFVDKVPILNSLYRDENGNSMIVPHWVIRQFTSPIIGMSRFFETGDFREVGYGFLDAFTAIPNSVMRLYNEADMTARLLLDEANAAADQGTAEGQDRAQRLLMTAFGIFERALLENQMINSMYAGADPYDRDPWSVPAIPGDEPHIGPDGEPLPTRSLEQYVDPETNDVQNAYVTREGTDGLRHQYAEHNLMFGVFNFVVSGFDKSYFRYGMPTKRREIELPQPEDLKAEAAIYGLYAQANPEPVELLTKEEIEYKLKADYSAAGIWWSDDKISEEAQVLYESGELTKGALSFMGPNGEAVTTYGGDRIIQSIYKGSTKLGSPELIGVAMDKEMRIRLEISIKQQLMEDGLKLGLTAKSAEYRAKRIWFGDDNDPDDVPLREILWSSQIPYSSKAEYNQLNVMYAIGPDGKPWATPFQRKTLGQAFLPFPHKQAALGSGLKRDERGMVIDEVLGINTGLAGLERVPQEPVDIKPEDTPFTISGEDESDKSDRVYRPWRRYGGGGGGGGGGSYTPQMRPLPGGIAARFDGLQMINTSNPILRRANVNRQRIWAERGRLKQWQ